MILTGEVEETVNSDALPSYRTVQSFTEQELSDSFGAHIHEFHPIEYGVIDDGQKNAVCHVAVEYFYKELQSLVATLSPNTLVHELIQRHESLVAQRRLLELTMATHLACFGDSDANIAEFQSDIVDVDKASLASRFVIEYAATCPPRGDTKFSIGAYDRLLAIASEIAYYGRVSDSLQYKLAAQDFELLRSGRLAHSDSRYESAMKAFQNEFYRRIAGKSREEFYRALSTKVTSEQPDNAEEIERVTAAEFGLPMSKLVDVLALIASSPYTAASGLGSCERSAMVKYVSSNSGLAASVIDSTLLQFSLGERANFLSPSSPFRSTDVFPWRFNRGLSYLRRPLIIRLVDGSETCVWGRRALNQAAYYIVNLCTTGQLKNARSREMSAYQGRVANRVGQRFNDIVAAEISKLSRYIVRKQIKKFCGIRLERENGESLGDIDVLAAAPDSRLIFTIEAKCFALAKTPVELANERDELFGDLAGKSGAVGRHLERTKWLQDNLTDVLRELGIKDSNLDPWQIRPLMVLDSDLISPRLVPPPFSILVLDKLVEYLAHLR